LHSNLLFLWIKYTVILLFSQYPYVKKPGCPLEKTIIHAKSDHVSFEACDFAATRRYVQKGIGRWQAVTCQYGVKGKDANENHKPRE